MPDSRRCGRLIIHHSRLSPSNTSCNWPPRSAGWAAGLVIEVAAEIGELLSVQFKQIRWDLNELRLSNRTTKGLRTRYIPLSQELRAMLELRRYDPDGPEFEPNAYVFGEAAKLEQDLAARRLPEARK